MERSKYARHAVDDDQREVAAPGGVCQQPLEVAVECREGAGYAGAGRQMAGGAASVDRLAVGRRQSRGGERGKHESDEWNGAHQRGSIATPSRTAVEQL